MFGLHALIKDAQTGVCLPWSSIFISCSLNQRSNISLGDWRSASELRSQLLPSWLHHANHTSINKILKNTPPVWNLMTPQEARKLIFISFSSFTLNLCWIWYRKAELWLDSREPSLLSINRKGIYKYALKSTGKKLKFLVLICWLVYTRHEPRGYFSCVSMEISTCFCCCSLDNSCPTW